MSFTVVAPGLSPDSSLCVAGSAQAWGPWQPCGLALTYMGDDRWRDVSLDAAVPGVQVHVGRVGARGLEWRPSKLNADLTVEGLVHVQDTVLAWSDANTARRVVGKSQGA